ncbi:MAG: hypothetical protein FWH48_06430 [Oscillospiraceae bacterium]|nr:hypothetical protein [Oscillospiraceae bacterium]
MSPAKYANPNELTVCRSFWERLYAEQSSKYKKDKDIIKAAKRRLHQAYGAFYKKDNIKAAKALLERCEDPQRLSEQLLGLCISSGERAGFVAEFYEFIFGAIPREKIKKIETIMDLGCGLNPFAFPFVEGADKNIQIKAYYAYDIGVELIFLANRYFALLGLPQCAECMDLIAELPTKAVDLVFMFKVFPILENCKKGRGFEILENLNFTYAAVSFPTKTLCGKDINMEKNYAAFFEGGLRRDKFELLGKKTFANELVYVLEKKQ